jgi:hypothetical protein
MMRHLRVLVLTVASHQGQSVVQAYRIGLRGAV